MVLIICMAVSFAASIVGAICGLGGGIVIKPVLDATGAVGVAEASILSSSTVLAMSISSLIKNYRSGERFPLQLGLPLAIGAALGGLIGKTIFQAICRFSGEGPAGFAQSLLLMLLTIGVLLYKLREDRIKPHIINSRVLAGFVGIFLGCFSALIGIGGGPINLLVLSYLLGMQGKEAVMSSLFIIAFSQTSALITSGVNGGFADFDILRLAGMIICGIGGGMIGSHIHRRISEKGNRGVLVGLLSVIIIICIFNLAS